MEPGRILIFTNGTLPDLGKARALVQPGDFIICVDGGTRHALSLGLTPALVIGDMDSITDADRAQLNAACVVVMQHPPEKDETDLELALACALERKPAEIVIVGALGGRLDQMLANLSLIADPRFASVDCCLDDGLEQVLFCRLAIEIHGETGDIVSLLPWGGLVAGVQTEGLKWRLFGETLYPGKTRGISNVMLGSSARLRIISGLLLIVHRRA